jgi:two-component sensor histidine kinase
LSLALVFHELAINAVKYGALSNGKAGKIDIGWHVEPRPEGDWMRLHWRERDGPPVVRSEHNGFGSRLIKRGLAQEVDGEVHLEYAPAGVICEIVMPIPQRGGWMNNE